MALGHLPIGLSHGNSEYGFGHRHRLEYLLDHLGICQGLFGGTTHFNDVVGGAFVRTQPTKLGAGRACLQYLISTESLPCALAPLFKAEVPGPVCNFSPALITLDLNSVLPTSPRHVHTLIVITDGWFRCSNTALSPPVLAAHHPCAVHPATQKEEVRLASLPSFRPLARQ